MAEWGFDNNPFLIAGPCSAESEAQILTTANALKASGKAAVFRAGVWKPRTRPGSFEGIGKPALKWLQKAKLQTGLPVATEVANPWHVDEVLKHDIDMLWIGARTTVNPFYVQEIANALKGVQIPVLVKNPLHPDLGLWMGAIERFKAAGVLKIAAIHRGFFTTKPSPFRNEPKWEMSFDLRAEMPDLPVICDPSHIAGKRELLQQVAQTALDINLDGFMIESHCNPDTALSDAAQQITPVQLTTLVDALVLKSENTDEEIIQKKLIDLRSQIDSLDTNLLEILRNRFTQVEAIGQIKKQDDITVFQMKRWFELMTDRQKSGQKLHLDAAFLQELFGLIHKYSVKRQMEIISEIVK